MTDRSIPLNLGPGTRLRFDRGDIKALEIELKVGYAYFTTTGFFGSLTSMEAFVWRGLKVENPEGKLVHVFPLTESGREHAGDLVMEYLQNNEASTLNDTIVDAMIAAGPWKKKVPGTTEEKGTGETPKN